LSIVHHTWLRRLLLRVLKYVWKPVGLKWPYLFSCAENDKSVDVIRICGAQLCCCVTLQLCISRHFLDIVALNEKLWVAYLWAVCLTFYALCVDAAMANSHDCVVCSNVYLLFMYNFVFDSFVCTHIYIIQFLNTQSPFSASGDRKAT